MIQPVPSAAMRFAGTAACNFPRLTYVVTSAVLPQYTTEFEMKFAPVTVRVNAEPPGRTVCGLMIETYGMGLVGIVAWAEFEYNATIPSRTINVRARLAHERFLRTRPRCCLPSATGIAAS